MATPYFFAKNKRDRAELILIETATGLPLK